MTPKRMTSPPDTGERNIIAIFSALREAPAEDRSKEHAIVEIIFLRRRQHEEMPADSA